MATSDNMTSSTSQWKVSETLVLYPPDLGAAWLKESKWVTYFSHPMAKAVEEEERFICITVCRCYKRKPVSRDDAEASDSQKCQTE